jgi:cell division protein YceG involved in septum cleavage
MMKRLWQKYSFVLILVAISYISVFAIAGSLDKTEDYIKVTVQDGESVWKLAEKFSNDHSLSQAEFVSWVEKENGIAGEVIHPGDELVIPVLVKKASQEEELTAFAGE